MITNCGLGISTDKALPERRENDFYETDMGTVRRVLGRVSPWLGTDPHRTILDPGAGAGAWGQGARELWPRMMLQGVELRDVPKPAGYDYWEANTDFLEGAAHSGWSGAFDLVMGNPPYRQAEAFVRAGLDCLRPGGVLVYLLRLAFLEGQGRRDGLFTQFRPRLVMVCSKRPSFTLDGKSNATSFAAFLWKRGAPPPDAPQLTWL